MKKIIFFAVFMCFAVCAVAQDSGWFITGNVGVSMDDQKDFVNGDKLTSFTIAPTVHKMISDKWALGLGLSFEYQKAKEADTKYNLFSIEPSAIYFVRICDKFYYTPTIFFGVGFGENHADQDITAFSGGLKPFSFEFRPCDSFALTFCAGDLSYSSIKYEKDRAKGTHKNFNLSLKDKFEVGFRYYF